MSFSPEACFLVWFHLIAQDDQAQESWKALRRFLYPLWVQIKVDNEDPEIMDGILCTILNPKSDKELIECALSELQFYDWELDMELHRQTILLQIADRFFAPIHLALHMLHHLSIMEEQVLSGKTPLHGD